MIGDKAAGGVPVPYQARVTARAAGPCAAEYLLLRLAESAGPDGAVPRDAAGRARELYPATFAALADLGLVVSDPHLASWRLGWIPPADPAGGGATDGRR